MMDDPTVNERFAAHVTGIAFSLQLSKAQIIKLVEVAGRGPDGGYTNYFRALRAHDTSVVSGRVLEEKGLVHAPDPQYPGLYELTDPGRLVFDLLKMAGLVERIEAKASAA